MVASLGADGQGSLPSLPRLGWFLVLVCRGAPNGEGPLPSLPPLGRVLGKRAGQVSLPSLPRLL